MNENFSRTNWTDVVSVVVGVYLQLYVSVSAHVFVCASERVEFATRTEMIASHMRTIVFRLLEATVFESKKKQKKTATFVRNRRDEKLSNEKIARVGKKRAHKQQQQQQQRRQRQQTRRKCEYARPFLVVGTTLTFLWSWRAQQLRVLPFLCSRELFFSRFTRISNAYKIINFHFVVCARECQQSFLLFESIRLNTAPNRCSYNSNNMLNHVFD